MSESKKHVICYSGGHSSALVAINVMLKYGKEDLILVNHDIASHIEHEDIKRFKQEVADYIGIPITYVNHPDIESNDQFDVCIKAKAFKVRNGREFCTSRLKTEPFHKYLKENFPDKNRIIYYGFDDTKRERIRMQTRSTILGAMGYKSDYPLALWGDDIIIKNTNEINIKPPLGYSMWKHANCVGCLKAGKQHWYMVFLYRKDVWEKAKMTEDIIGHAILGKEEWLDEMELDFIEFEKAGITTTEHENSKSFFNRAKKIVANFNMDFTNKQCRECVS